MEGHSEGIQALKPLKFTLHLEIMTFLNLFLVSPYLVTSFSSFSHSHAFLFSLLLLLVDFDLGSFLVLVLEQRIRHTKIVDYLLNVQ